MISYLPLNIAFWKPEESSSSSEITGLSRTDKANFYTATNFNIDQAFADFWKNQGGLPVFGYPISRSFTENGLKVQYFERARLELIPATATQAAYITLGLLGQELLAASK